MTTWPTLPDGRYAILRTCRPDGTTSYDFTWDLTLGATNTAPDWDPDPSRDCGGGLHGLLWGCGDGDLLHAVGEPDTVWMVAAVAPADVATPIDRDWTPAKVRFRCCEVLHLGDRTSAPAWLIENGAAGLPVVYGTATAGNRGTATAGDWGTATAGYSGTATAGNRGTATAGNRGTATAGDWGTATAGYSGTATAGNRGTATAGNSGTATAGYSGTATAGKDGVISIEFYDHSTDRYRRRIGEVDGTTILANTPYRVVNGELTAVAS